MKKSVKKISIKQAGKKNSNVTIFSQLSSEHEDLKKLLNKTEDAEPQERLEYLAQICDELIPHARGEEKTLYALFRIRAQEANNEDKLDLANEGYEEHLVADKLIEDLKELDPESERWIPMFKVLKENLEHHIREEENEIFKACRKLLSKEEQDIALESYLAAKEQFAQELPAQKDISERTLSPEAESLLAMQ